KLTTAKNRPEAIAAWIKRHRNAKASIPPMGPDFCKRMKTWWSDLQPEWRNADNIDNMTSWGTGNVPADTNWGGLDRGGTAGLYTVVVPLAWSLSDESPSKDELWPMVDDVAWALS
ncbi:hypothetical protein FA15DRAFT_547960, partial [Coprinopsis marcescibilis]